MIELNLVPDVKQELLKAQRARTAVISVTILIGIVSAGIVIMLVLYLFGVQTVRHNLADGAIKSNNAKLENIDDLSNTLTIQNQLEKLKALHDDKNIDSRVFAILTAINPPAPNTVGISTAKLDADTKQMTIEGQAENGYEAAEIFKKTILSTKISYEDEDKTTQKTLLTTDVSTSDMSYGEDASGKKVLRFTFSFTYPDEIFARSSLNAVIERPDRKNVTDSHLRVPLSLFSERAADIKGEN